MNDRDHNGDLNAGYIWPLCSKEQIRTDGSVILASGEGSRVTDVDGAEYLDLTSGITRASALGHGNAAMVSAVSEQVAKLHYGGQVDFQADVVFELAAKLAALTPDALGATYFTTGGTTANEAAFKLARLYQRESGAKPRAYKIISRWNGYHGAVGTPMAASDWLGVRPPAEPGTPGVSLVAGPTCYRSPLRAGGPPGAQLYLSLLEQQIVHEGPELVAAFIAEPIMQADGVQIPPPEYLPGVREICSRYEVLLIADEVITGFGRTGGWFAVNHWDVQPDMITMAKALTAGYMPLGAVTARDDIWAALPAFPDVNTFGGHPVAAAAALAAIGVYEREGLVERARDSGKELLTMLSSLERHDVVGEVRGLGLWAAIDFTSDPASRAPLDWQSVRDFVLQARADGVIVGQNGSAIELAPRLDAPLAEMQHGVDVLDRAIEKAARLSKIRPSGSGPANRRVEI